MLKLRHSVWEIRSSTLRRFFDLQYASLWYCLSHAAPSVSPQAFILDFGSGDSPYRSLFPTAATWRTFDLEKKADFKSWPEIPASEKYQIILALEVLEHLKDPRGTFLEPAKRHLAEGGEIWISVPYSVRIHPCPEDWRRWTPDGLRSLIEDSGFHILSFEFRGPFPQNLIAKLCFGNFLLLKSKKYFLIGLTLFPLSTCLLALTHLFSPKKSLEDIDPLGFFLRIKVRAAGNDQ